MKTLSRLTPIVLLLATPLATAAGPTDKEKADIIGQPTALVVQPESVTLHGPRDTRQLLVTGKYADGAVRDLTGCCTLTAETEGIVGIGGDGFLQPLKEGTTTLRIQAGAQTARLAVEVKDFATPHPVGFRNEFMAALNVSGCNMGACHGTPSGKGGFKLTLRGYGPAQDYLQLTRDVLGRRTDRINPDASLILQKGLGQVPHEGGQRLSLGSIAHQTIRAWLLEGLRDDPANLPEATKIEVLPGARLLKSPGKWQQMAVLAHYADGSVRDVTRLTVFSSSDTQVAEVNANGLVEFNQPGEVAVNCRYLLLMEPVRLTYLEPRAQFTWSNPPENNYVDKHVFAKLKMLSILPSELCSDAEFVRRIYLDVCGILPTSDEVKTFLDDKAPNKRALLIDKLLERPEYADFWTMKWSDVLRSNRKQIQVKGIHVYQHWLRNHMARNTPFDQVVRELLTANGSTFANPPANFYRIARDPESLAETTAQLFFGIRMQCAKCHNHPFERWTQNDYYSLAAFFARVGRAKDRLEAGPGPKDSGAEFIFGERSGELTRNLLIGNGLTFKPKFMGGPTPEIKPGEDRRQVLAAWLTGKENPFFPKSVVNRVWFHLNGRGIVDPVDDFRDSNPSANDELLDALAKDFVAHQFDLKHLIRAICNSRTYQLSAQTNDTNKDDAKYFSRATTKLLPAEVLLDAICQATDVPEKFPGLPMGTRATQLPDGEVNHVFLKTFGQPGRELACECERESDSNLAQALQLINGPTLNDKARHPNNRLGKLLAGKLPEPDILADLYLATLSRPPSEEEKKAALAHIAKAPDKRKAWEDVQWALLNAKEFLFRH